MRRGSKAAVALVVLALVAAACGSSKKSTSTATTSGGANTTSGGSAAGTSNDFIVEGVAAKTDHPGTDTGFQARITRFNNAGGIQGRKVKFLGVQDDASNPSNDLTAVQSIVLKDHVFALAPVVSTVFLAPSGDFVVQNKVPTLGYGAVPSFCNNSYLWGYAGCQQTTQWNTTTGPELLSAATGIKIPDMKLAIEGLSLQAAVTANTAAAKTFQALGATVVFNKNEVPLLGQNTDYTPFVQGIIASKANMVFEVTDLANSIALAGALKQGGYKGVIFNGTSYLPSQLATQPNMQQALDGVYTIVQAPAQEDQSPAIKQEEADLKAIGASTTIDLGTNIGYWVADMFVQLLQAAAKNGPITQQSFRDASAAGVTLNPSIPGGNGPLIFNGGSPTGPLPDYQRQPMPCAALVQAKGNHYVDSVKYTCYKNIPLS
jgi:ABC-type branched-subunit amino acid transport system substrate-binding protein